MVWHTEPPASRSPWSSPCASCAAATTCVTTRSCSHRPHRPGGAARRDCTALRREADRDRAHRRPAQTGHAQLEPQPGDGAQVPGRHGRRPARLPGGALAGSHRPALAPEEPPSSRQFIYPRLDQRPARRCARPNRCPSTISSIDQPLGPHHPDDRRGASQPGRPAQPKPVRRLPQRHPHRLHRHALDRDRFAAKNLLTANASAATSTPTRCTTWWPMAPRSRSFTSVRPPTPRWPIRSQGQSQRDGACHPQTLQGPPERRPGFLRPA